MRLSTFSALRRDREQLYVKTVRKLNSLVTEHDFLVKSGSYG